MSTHHSASMSPLQVQVAAGLAAGQSITAAARAAGLHRSTIHGWFAESAMFREEYEKIRARHDENLVDDLRELESLALQNMRDLMIDAQTPPSVRLKASLAVLERCRKAGEPWSLPQLPALDAAQPLPPTSLLPSGTARNAPCPCGSGEKHKRCCGKDAPPHLSMVASQIPRGSPACSKPGNP